MQVEVYTNKVRIAWWRQQHRPTAEMRSHTLPKRSQKVASQTELRGWRRQSEIIMASSLIARHVCQRTST